MLYDGQDLYRWKMLSILSQRHDIRYRMGVIAGFRSSDRISQQEWEELRQQILERKEVCSLNGDPSISNRESPLVLNSSPPRR